MYVSVHGPEEVLLGPVSAVMHEARKRRRGVQRGTSRVSLISREHKEMPLLAVVCRA